MAVIGKRTVLITGASSGIGLSLAREFARRDYNLILVAAHMDRLRVAESELEKINPQIDIHCIQADLATEEGPFDVFHQVKLLGVPINVLVNNAGVGVYGMFKDTDYDSERSLIQLNIISVVVLTKLFLPDMLAQKNGHILMTSSVLAMSGAPQLSVYAASKSFIYSFVQGIRDELSNDNIVVTALLPGATDTDFFARAGMLDTHVAHKDMVDPDVVAKDAVDALLAGKDHVVTPLKDRIAAVANKFIPDSLSAKAARIE